MEEVLDGPLGLIFGLASLVFIFAWMAVFVRVSWLHHSGRSPDAPSAAALLFGRFGMALSFYIWSSQHRALRDPLTSGLVWASRLGIGATMLLAGAMWVVVLAQHLRW